MSLGFLQIAMLGAWQPWRCRCWRISSAAAGSISCSGGRCSFSSSVARPAADSPGGAAADAAADGDFGSDCLRDGPPLGQWWCNRKLTGRVSRDVVLVIDGSYSMGWKGPVETPHAKAIQWPISASTRCGPETRSASLMSAIRSGQSLRLHPAISTTPATSSMNSPILPGHPIWPADCVRRCRFSAARTTSPAKSFC